MRNRTWLVLVAVVLALSSSLANEAPRKPRGIFSSLKVGQPVNLKDHGAAFSISFLDEGLPLTHKVVEISDDYVVVEEIAGMTETVVPVYSLRGVVRTRTKITK
jgi:hypothetical protein